jgi:hypothetical protein
MVMSDLIEIHSDDDDATRAINILSAGGVIINETARERILPRMANAIRIYRELDDMARMYAPEASDTIAIETPKPSAAEIDRAGRP